MDATLIEGVILLITAQAMAVANLLAPIGENMTYSFIILSCVMIGVSMATGGGFLGQILTFTMWSAGTLFLVKNWPLIIEGSLDTANALLSILTGSSSVVTLFEAGAQVVARILAEPAGWEFSLNGTVGALTNKVMLSLVAVIVAAGLAIPALLALLAQLNLVLGCAVAPIILPALAFEITRPIGFAVINFIIAATVRIAVLGALSAMFSQAILQQINLPGADEVLTAQGSIGLFVTAIFAALAGFSASAIAGQLVGHGAGSLGLSSVSRASGAVNSATSGAAGASTAAGAVLSAGGAAVKAGGAYAGSAARSVGSIGRSSGTGSAFS